MVNKKWKSFLFNNTSSVNSLAETFIKQIIKIIDFKINQLTTITSAIVTKNNKDGTVDLCLPPDNQIFHGVSNQSLYQDLTEGDCVKVIKQNNQTSNMWIVGAHKSVVDRHKEFIQQLQRYNMYNTKLCLRACSGWNYGVGSYIKWNQIIFDNSKDLISYSKNNTNDQIKINHTGYIKVSLGLHASSLQSYIGVQTCLVKNKPNQTTPQYYASINCNCVGKDTFMTLSNCIIPVQNGDTIGVYIHSFNGEGEDCYISVVDDVGCNSSYITIEFIQ